MEVFIQLLAGRFARSLDSKTKWPFACCLNEIPVGFTPFLGSPSQLAGRCSRVTNPLYTNHSSVEDIGSGLGGLWILTLIGCGMSYCRK